MAKGRAQSKQKIGHLIAPGVTQCALQRINPIRGSSLSGYACIAMVPDGPALFPHCPQIYLSLCLALSHGPCSRCWECGAAREEPRGPEPPGLGCAGLGSLSRGRGSPEPPRAGGAQAAGAGPLFGAQPCCPEGRPCLRFPVSRAAHALPPSLPAAPGESFS